MNKRYIIYAVSGDYTDWDISSLNDVLSEAIAKDNETNIIDFPLFNEALKQYGLYWVRHHLYEVIDETLFGLFLLEYSDELNIMQPEDE